MVLCIISLPVVTWSGFEDVGHSASALASSGVLVVLGCVFLVFVSTSNYFNIVVVANSGIVTKEVWR